MFRRMKKTICIGVLSIVWMIPVSAQQAVVDFPHILETIHNGYLMYQSILNSIQQLDYAYQTTQMQLQQLQQLKVEDIQSFTDAVSFVDKQISFVRRTENRFKSIGVTVGGKTIPLTQFYRIPGEAEQMVINDMTQPMSDWEKARAWSYYGLNPANYFYVRAWEGRIQEASKQMSVISDVINENNEKTAQEITEIGQTANQSGSELAVLQASMAMLQILIGEQMEANRLNAMALQYQSDKDKASELPVSSKSRFSSDWYE